MGGPPQKNVSAGVLAYILPCLGMKLSSKNRSIHLCRVLNNLFQFPPNQPNRLSTRPTNRPTNQPFDRPTDQPTNQSTNTHTHTARRRMWAWHSPTRRHRSCPPSHRCPSRAWASLMCCSRAARAWPPPWRATSKKGHHRLLRTRDSSWCCLTVDCILSCF